MASEQKRWFADADPSTIGGNFVPVTHIDLIKSPVGQGFLINRPGNRLPIFGIVDDPEWPVVLMRKNAFGEPIHRLLQIPSSERVAIVDLPPTEQARELRRASQYVESMHGRGGTWIPQELIPGTTGHFLEIDADGNPVGPNTKRGQGVNISSIGILAVQLALPLHPDTPRIYPHPEQLEYLVGEHQA